MRGVHELAPPPNVGDLTDEASWDPTEVLRRREAFHFTWKDDASIGNGRTSVWVHPEASLVFKYYGSRPPRLNHAWLEALAAAANSPAGLYLVPEPAPAAESPDTGELVTADG